ncbi:hypothetical protein SNOG_06431 [Parastagonospora nodorum SN15]|uniref:Uncharacterized protein n=1 Tax=Phaeosphaeria nodorum (strain SN15 / ATCC MYA-4574 / FGSC 10173) TaxID=321614 RepID=Q0UP83_PHANO|nr:hypothetical protein SNOG_06431 [Parastagonospora nodorum SN15]EAT86262.1 hypothetical protein SNOG_06431 [Parastagonospora nodorum SN15]
MFTALAVLCAAVLQCCTTQYIRRPRPRPPLAVDVCPPLAAPAAYDVPTTYLPLSPAPVCPGRPSSPQRAFPIRPSMPS